MYAQVQFGYIWGGLENLLFQVHFQRPQSADKHLRAPQAPTTIILANYMPTSKWLAMNQNHTV